MARFAGKVVIVTGAASGIGEGAAKRFAAEGATLVLGDKDATGLEKVAGGLGALAVGTQVADVSDMAACDALAALASERYGQIDVIVNHAGVDHLGKLDEGELSEFAKVIESELYGVLQMSGPQSLLCTGLGAALSMYRRCPAWAATGSTASIVRQRVPAGVIAFLAVEDAHYVTGVNLAVDTGLSVSNGQPRLS